jgi:hypothetical protein
VRIFFFSLTNHTATNSTVTGTGQGDKVHAKRCRRSRPCLTG